MPGWERTTRFALHDPGAGTAAASHMGRALVGVVALTLSGAVGCDDARATVRDSSGTPVSFVRVGSDNALPPSPDLRSSDSWGSDSEPARTDAHGASGTGSGAPPPGGVRRNDAARAYHLTPVGPSAPTPTPVVTNVTINLPTSEFQVGEFASVGFEITFWNGAVSSDPSWAEWLVGDPSVAWVVPFAPPLLLALGPGTTTITARAEGMTSNILVVEVSDTSSGPLDGRTTQWYPYLEWSFENPSWSGNPFDVTASATFTHGPSGSTHTTRFFYDGGNTWKCRFTGTLPGTWSATTKSPDDDLNGRWGTVTVEPNPGSPGFVGHQGNRWIRTGTGEAYVPQLVMYAGPQWYWNDPDAIDQAIQVFLNEHGFTGFHVPVYCRWFDLDDDKCSGSDTPEPDLRTFEALELLITRVYEAGGTVHLWQWGDAASGRTPTPWGYNGPEDKRLQRYIAARLGPLPGWSMGYGYDVWEYGSEQILDEWHATMQEQLGWTHLLGARSYNNSLDQISETLDYSGYEQWKPDYEKYLETIGARPEKPSLSEDRFRIRQPSPHPHKDYDEEETRRGLWHSTMAGGVGNIWGNLVGANDANTGEIPSAPYQNIEWVRTNARFFEGRFSADLERANALTNGVALKRPDRRHYLFYREETSNIQLDLSAMDGRQNAVAVDALAPYAELPLGILEPNVHTWNAPYESDWAIAVGDF